MGMFAYSTNNPQYLEYVARNLTREEIAAHPQLCQWLNNPYVKDNMELAIRYAEAEQGNYTDKKNFVEYFMCNGPELEADTLLYYREKILIDPTYRQIGYTFYSDIDKVVQLRSDIYGKSNVMTSKDRHGNNYDWFNCFKNPCNYLGPFSARQGTLGDLAIMSSTPNNTLAERAHTLGLGGNSAYPAGPSSTLKSPEQQRDKDAAPPPQGASGTRPADVKGGPLPRWLIHLLPPAQEEEYAKYIEMRNQQNIDHVKRLAEAGKLTNVQAGDPNVITMAEAMKVIVKGNARRFLGDCSKLWTQVRNYNPFDPKFAKQTPISSAEIVGNVAPNGQAATVDCKNDPILAAPKGVAMEKLINSGEYSTYMKNFGTEETKNWTKEQFYQALVDELNKDKPDWSHKVQEYVAGFMLKAGKKVDKAQTYDMFIKELILAPTTGQSRQEILWKYGITLSNESESLITDFFGNKR